MFNRAHMSIDVTDNHEIFAHFALRRKDKLAKHDSQRECSFESVKNEINMF